MKPVEIAILVFIGLILAAVVATVAVAICNSLGLPMWVEFLLSGICGYMLGRYLAKKWIKRL